MHETKVYDSISNYQGPDPLLQRCCGTPVADAFVAMRASWARPPMRLDNGTRVRRARDGREGTIVRQFDAIRWQFVWDGDDACRRAILFSEELADGTFEAVALS